jgi:hypothetical protein
MYNVFSQYIITSKEKVCVQAHEKDLDAQKVYKDQVVMPYSESSFRNISFDTKNMFDMLNVLDSISFHISEG